MSMLGPREKIARRVRKPNHSGTERTEQTLEDVQSLTGYTPLEYLKQDSIYTQINSSAVSSVRPG